VPSTPPITPPDASELPPVFGCKPLAAFLGVSPRTITSMVRDGRLPAAIRLGSNLLRWRRETILAWIREREDSNG
jgi:excisionase family DNA binding protein